MDKLGIFKLLNSLYNFYQSNLKDKNAKKDVESSNGVDSSPITTKQNEVEEKKQTPIQGKMLNTLNNHDQFVRRVKEKHLT